MKISIVTLLIKNFYSYPNNSLPQHKGKEITQYLFFELKHIPFFTALHDL